MFIRRKKNKRGSGSIQIIDKSSGYKGVKTIGSTKDPKKIKQLGQDDQPKKDPYKRL